MYAIIIFTASNKLNLIEQFVMQIRALGACGYVLVSSFLIRENILALVSVLLYSILRVRGIKKTGLFSNFYSISDNG